jgi:hypothetical protein
MSYIEQLRRARSSRTAILHKFLTNYDPNSERIYAFVEGDADEAFYRAQIQKYVPEQKLIYTFNCEGKAGVAEAYKEVVAKYPGCERVLFFFDKDIDDIVGVQWPSDPRIYVTEFYSIENYVVNKQILSRYFKDYVKIRKVEVAIDEVLERFDADLAHFHKLILPVMAWIVIMRRSGTRVNLQNLDLGQLFDVTDNGNCRRAKRCAIAYLVKATQASSPVPPWTHLRASCIELRRHLPKTYVRGKFEAWWFVEFCRRIVEALQEIVKEADGSIKIHAQLHPNTFIQLLAGGVETPVPLNNFLAFHSKRRMPQNTADPHFQAAGMLQSIKKLFMR